MVTMMNTDVKQSFLYDFKKEILKKAVENLFLMKDLILQRDYKTRQRNQDVLLVLSA